jgi:4a-hydroxytetrahydrobiopterin dehydratase
MSETALVDRHCQHQTSKLDAVAARSLLKQLHPDWSISEDGLQIERRFKFKNYYQTIAFVNALAWIVHQQDHHPQLLVGYNHCTTGFSTHSVGGLSENDFICAAKIDALPGSA